MWREIPFVWSTPQCMQHWVWDSFQGLLSVLSHRVAQVYQLGLDDRDDREPLVFLEGPEHLYCGHSFCRRNNAVSISKTIIIDWILPISVRVHHLGMMGVFNPLMRIFKILHFNNVVDVGRRWTFEKNVFFFTKVINNSMGSVLIHYLKGWGRGCSEDFRGSHGFKGERRGDQ